MDLLAELIGKKVTVHSIQGDAERQDVGTLEAVQGNWLRLRKSGNEVLFFGVVHIRLVKPFDPM